MQFLLIILVCVLSAIVYGVIHDQITARICVEYFTIGHPPIFNTESPTLLGFGWGIVATWWVGLILGFPLACAARLGSSRPWAAKELIKPVSILLGVMGIGAFLAGLTAFMLASKGTIQLPGVFASSIPVAKHIPFLVDMWTHSASYLFGFVGAVVLIVWTWRKRERSLHEPSSTPFSER
jgi:drug/metabolite transporter (DMT)-like permease